MKEIYKEYLDEVKKILKNKTYMYAIILIAILSYGFTITNFSIGIDDLCFDRYVTGPYILSAGRWGTTLLYSIFQIFSFTPFWLELIVTLLTVFMGIIFTAFINKNLNGKLNSIHCIIITGLLISYPILHQSFIYQSTNLSVIICNIALIILPIIIYENHKRKGKFKNYIFIALILPFFISMYESCCQTFILMTAIIMFIEIYNNKNNRKVEIGLIKYFCLSILIIGVALIVNAFINRVIKIVLSNNNMLVLDYSSKNIPWIKYEFNYTLNLFKNNILVKICNDFVKLAFVREFIVLAILTLVIVIAKSIKDKKYLLIPLIFVIILSNFAINLLQVRILYRVDTSWCFALAFFTTIVLITIKDKKLNDVICIAFCALILLQTKQMNQYFYNDYVRYQRESSYAQYIANEIIIKCEDTKKPIVYILEENDGIHQNRINQDNGWSIINWGAKGAFGQPGSELTKFINSLGYNFTIATNAQTKDALEKYKDKINDLRNNEIIYETENYIFVVIEYNI